MSNITMLNPVDWAQLAEELTNEAERRRAEHDSERHLEAAQNLEMVRDDLPNLPVKLKNEMEHYSEQRSRGHFAGRVDVTDQVDLATL